MIHLIQATLIFFVSSQALASTLDFRKVPQDSVVVCNGSDVVNRQFATRLYYSPHKTITDDTKNLFYALVNTTKSEHFEFLAASFVRKSIPDKETLATILKSQLGVFFEESFIEQLASQKANYPLSLVLGKNAAESKSSAVEYILSITGFDGGKDVAGKAIEVTLSAFYIKPSETSTEKAQLASFSYQLCNFAPLSELFSDVAPIVPETK